MWILIWALTFACSVDEVCTKVDILVVVDNSGSMSDKQETLGQNFSNMIQQIKGVDSIEDYRIGVITTDSYDHNREGCRGLGDLVDRTPDWSKQSDFDFTLQGLLDFLSQDDVPINACLGDSSTPWISHDDPDLVDKFSCIVKVGAKGDGHERPLEAFRNSLSSPCNAGFFRDDALLVTLVVTDEDAGTHEWLGSLFDDIVEERNGLPNQVVFVPIVDPENSTQLTQFAQRFPNHFIGEIASSDYGGMLRQAATKVETACKAYGQQCPTTECCLPTDPVKLLAGYGLPALVFGLFGFLSSSQMAQRAVKAGRSGKSAAILAWALAALFAGILAFVALAGFCTNCLPDLAWAYVGVWVLLSLGLFGKTMGLGK